jgi:hypothetical protein
MHYRSMSASPDSVTGAAKDAVSPYGSIFPFHWLFRCCAKRVRLDNGENYDVLCGNFTYTTDGRAFVGHYTPDSAEDLDPFLLMPAEYIFCCGCCCAERFYAWFERQLDARGKYKDELGSA